jgi:hypothetical protein
VALNLRAGSDLHRTFNQSIWTNHDIEIKLSLRINNGGVMNHPEYLAKKSRVGESSCFLTLMLDRGRFA